MTHRFFACRAWYFIALLALVLLLSACGGQTPTLNPENVVSVTRTNGAATLTRPAAESEGELPENALLVVGDHLYTAADQTVTLQFSDGSTLTLEPNSHVMLLDINSTNRMALFRLLAGAILGDVRRQAFEVQGYKEVALNFNMVVTELAAIPRATAGNYHLGFEGNLLKAVINSGEFDVRSGSQQATLPAGWQAIAEPGKPLQIALLITPTPAAGMPTTTPIQIISITPTDTPTPTPIATSTVASTATATPTATPTPTRTRVPRTFVPATSTPLPAPTEKPTRRPQATNPPPPTDRPPTNPPPTNPPPTNPPPTNPPPTNPPPTEPPPPPTQRPTPG